MVDNNSCPAIMDPEKSGLRKLKLIALKSQEGRLLAKTYRQRRLFEWRILWLKEMGFQ
jgi:hypothetical protein